MIIVMLYLIQNSQPVKEGHSEKRCEIQSGSQEMVG